MFEIVCWPLFLVCFRNTFCSEVGLHAGFPVEGSSREGSLLLHLGGSIKHTPKPESSPFLECFVAWKPGIYERFRGIPEGMSLFPDEEEDVEKLCLGAKGCTKLGDQVTPQNVCKMIFVSGDCNFGVYNNMWTVNFEVVDMLQVWYGLGLFSYCLVYSLYKQWRGSDLVMRPKLEANTV